MDVRLPGSFREALSDEFHRAVRPPYEIPLVVLINGLLVVGFWFSRFKDQMFTLHGTLAFPIVLGSWMLSDVPVTNMLGLDRARILAALDDDRMMMRLITAKATLLWLLVAPVCVVIAIAIGIYDDRPISALWTVIAIGILPVGALAVSNWVGILWPYHPVSLKTRWHERREIRGQIRWVILICVPFIVVPLIIAVIALPAIVWWHHQTGGAVKPISDGLFGQLVLLSAATSAGAFFVSRWITRQLLRYRRAKLHSYLAVVQVQPKKRMPSADLL